MSARLRKVKLFVNKSLITEKRPTKKPSFFNLLTAQTDLSGWEYISPLPEKTTPKDFSLLK